MADNNHYFSVGVSAKLLTPEGRVLLPDVDLSPLSAQPGVTMYSLPDVGDGELTADMLADTDAVILFLERISPRSFAPGDNRLCLVARYGVGYDTIDVPACTANDVMLAITPDGVRRPVAMSVITLMLALTMRLMDKDRITRDVPRGWQRKTDYNGMGLTGRTLGVLGVGNIGSEVFRMARPFDLSYIAHDPLLSAERQSELTNELSIEFVDIDALFTRADILSVNCLLNESTTGVVSADLLALMQPHAYLINTSRGPVVDEPALIGALQAGTIAGAGLDVFHDEPPASDNPLLAMKNVILAPHALCFTDECIAGLGAADVAACLAVARGDVPSAVVNTSAASSPGVQAKLNRYRRYHAAP